MALRNTIAIAFILIGVALVFTIIGADIGVISVLLGVLLELFSHGKGKKQQ